MLICIILLLSLSGHPGWQARVRAGGPWYVDSAGDDSGDCLSRATACRTVGAALRKAEAGDTLNVAAGSYAENLLITADITINGAGAGATILDGGRRGGVLAINVPTVRANLADLTIRGGQSVGSGGGITNFGSLTLANTIVQENATSLGEGFQGWGGGIANFGTLAMTGTTVLSNTAYFGGGVYNRGALTAVNSTISGNSARNDGGGINNSRAKVFTLNNVTIAGNTADSDGDGNGNGGGLNNEQFSAAGLRNTLVAGNSSGGKQASDCRGTLSSQGANLVQSLEGCTLAGNQTGDITGKDARLGPLQDNGGPTPTQALLDDSPAIDAGDDATCAPTDQRSVARPQGRACDIGAFEAQPRQASGAWYVAPAGSDNNDCQTPTTACRTLGAALGRAQSGSTINLAAGAYAENLTITTAITINGDGAETTILDGGGRAGVLAIPGAGTRVSLAGLTIRGGQSASSGGGISNYGTLAIADSVVQENQVTLSEGFQGLGGGIANFGALVMTATIVADNSGVFGGGIANSGTMTITGSTISNNSGFFGGGLANFGRQTVISSTIRRNSALIGGGGANFGTLTLERSNVVRNTALVGAGIANFANLTIINGTISGNAARNDGGGISNGRRGVVTLNNATIASNTADSDGDGAGDGGGISNDVESVVNARNTLLANNSDQGGQSPDCRGNLNSQGHNLIQTTTGCTITGDAAGNLSGQDPRLGPPTDDSAARPLTLLVGSPAIDAGDSATCAATDQRGTARPQGVACDIGAFEMQVGQSSAAGVYLPLVVNDR